MEPKEIFLQFTGQTSPDPMGLEIASAEGIYIFGPNGEKYMDLISGISVLNVGHQHPHVVKAIKEQVDSHLHLMAYGEYIQKPVNKLAEKLVGLLHPRLNCIYFVNSGTEANEAAIKLAKRHTGRKEIVSFFNSYHGNTLGSLSVTGNETKKYAFRPLLPMVRFIHFNDEEELNQITTDSACVIVEPVQGDAGVVLPRNGFLKKLRRRCDDTGTMLIFDEVQTGFGRSGRLFAYEHFDVVPDIISMAKAMGGGLPIGAFASHRDVMHKLTFDPSLGHITTFGGNPVSCAAGSAVLDVLTGSDLITQVEDKGELFEQLLIHPKIIEIRRLGLMMAVEFESEELVRKIVNGCRQKGVITYFFLSNRNSFRLAPPLVITNEEITEACQIILGVIDEI